MYLVSLYHSCFYILWICPPLLSYYNQLFHVLFSAWQWCEGGFQPRRELPPGPTAHPAGGGERPPYRVRLRECGEGRRGDADGDDAELYVWILKRSRHALGMRRVVIYLAAAYLNIFLGCRRRLSVELHPKMCSFLFASPKLAELTSVCPKSLKGGGDFLKILDSRRQITVYFTNTSTVN